jgi:hypothetical protein
VSVGLSGNLRDFGIADVFQLIGQQRKTGVLDLKRRTERVQLSFDHGAVVTAVPLSGRSADADPLAERLARCGFLHRDQVDQLLSQRRASARSSSRLVVDRGWLSAEEVERVEDLLTRDTIFDVLRWASGSFDFRAQEVEHDRDPNTLLGAEQILMDGLRMVDEWQSFAGRVPSDTAVFHHVNRFEVHRQQASASSPSELEDAELVFDLIDGDLSAGDVLDRSMLGRFDASRHFAALRRSGVIAPLHAQGVRRLGRHAREATRAVAARSWIAACLPLALLLLTALSTRPAEPTTARAPGTFPIERPSLESLREAHATRRIRNAIDSFVVAQGHWPADLEALEERGFLDPKALTPPPGRPYYFSKRHDRLVVLAPER